MAGPIRVPMHSLESIDMATANSRLPNGTFVKVVQKYHNQPAAEAACRARGLSMFVADLHGDLLSLSQASTLALSGPARPLGNFGLGVEERWHRIWVGVGAWAMSLNQTSVQLPPGWVVGGGCVLLQKWSKLQSGAWLRQARCDFEAFFACQS
jgi:hypothetical protein